MSLAVHALEPARAVVPGLSIWWAPARIAVRRRSWKTHRYPEYARMAGNSQTVAVSPISIDGMVHFVAFDVDSGYQGDVHAILKALPHGAVPHVSHSGNKGWHVWLFPNRPIPLKDALRFGRHILERSGVACEVFPTGRNSRCLKWPGSVHPETGRREAFVPAEDLTDTDALDTPILLQAIADGFYRTPAQVFGEAAPDRYRPDAGPVPGSYQTDTDLEKMAGFPGHGGHTHLGYGGPSAANSLRVQYTFETHETDVQRTCSTRALARYGASSLAALPEVAFGLAELAGRRVSKPGRPFRCILPGHEERKPSASFYVSEDGRILYHDFHRRGGGEWYTLGEVYHAVTTGVVRKLRPVDSARWLARLALRLNLLNDHAKTTQAALDSLTPLITSGEHRDIYVQLVVKPEELLGETAARAMNWQESGGRSATKR